MSIQLRVRLLLAVLLGALLIASFGTALQFLEIANSATERLGPDAKLLAAAAEMQRLLGETMHEPAFEAAFGEQLELIESSDMTDDERELVATVRARYEQLLVSHDGDLAPRDALLVAEAVAALTAKIGHDAKQSAEQLADRSTTTAAGLALFGVLALVLGAGGIRSLHRRFLRPLSTLERAALDVSSGDDARRVPALGNDELTRIANALNHVLDARDRSVAELDGRNRDMRALLVSLLRAWTRPAAVASIDGDILASTLNEIDEAHVRAISPQVRKAAGILLSRGFASAAELSTDVSFADGTIVHVRALALADQRFVGWLAECVHRPERE